MVGENEIKLDVMNITHISLGSSVRFFYRFVFVGSFLSRDIID